MISKRVVLGAALTAAVLTVAASFVGTAAAAKTPKVVSPRIGPFGLVRGRGVVVGLRGAARLGRTVPAHARMLNAANGAVLGEADIEIPYDGTATLHFISVADDGALSLNGNSLGVTVPPGQRLEIVHEFRMPALAAKWVRGTAQLVDLSDQHTTSSESFFDVFFED